MKHINIPIFIQHMGCPNQCVFCDQNAITGAHSFCMESVRRDIEKVLSTTDGCEREIAFFGGSFTGIDRSLMLSLLDTAQEYVDSGEVCGIRMSTRPDYISAEITDILHRYTVSQVELGIQSFDDSVLYACKRGHRAEESYKAMRLLRSEGFSVVGQMMIGLPASCTENEKRTAEIICNEGAASTRIYPCVVFRKTELEQMTRRGEYIPLNTESAVKRSAAVFEVFLDRNVPVLKTGLHEGESLHDENTYFAGPNHPALGELVKGRVMLYRILSALPEGGCTGHSIVIHCASGAASLCAGHKKVNKALIMEKTGAKSVKIVENPSLTGYNISIDCQ